MNALIVALLLSQTPATPTEVQGARNTIATTIAEYQLGLRTYTFTSGRTRICVKPRTTLPQGTVVLKMGAFILTPDLLASLGIPAAPSDEYAGLEVQAVPALEQTYGPRLTNPLWDLIDADVWRITTPTDATCEVLIIRASDASIANWLTCACRSGNKCTFDLDGAGPYVPITAPYGVTLQAGTWSGANCTPKSCYTKFDGPGIDRSWPVACPLQ